MALDHYVSQVHLRNFYSAQLGSRMHAMRKVDLKYYQCNSYSQCRIEDGSTNKYLNEQRAIEDFLLGVERNYNKAVAAFLSGRMDSEDISAIAGFVAYVMTCSPGGMRINTPPLEGSLALTAAILEQRGQLPPPPEILGHKSFVELLQSNVIRFHVDPKFPQALGIGAIYDFVKCFGNCYWDIIVSEHQDCTFATSDFPVAAEKHFDPRLVTRVVPLTSRVAVRIIPNAAILQDGSDLDFRFKHFRFRLIKASRRFVAYINRLIVRAAETTVYYSIDSESVRRFIKRNRNYRMDTLNQVLPTGNGYFQISRQQIVRHVFSPPNSSGIIEK